MSDYTPAEERNVHTGICSNDECKTTIAIWPHWERTTDLPGSDEWDSGFFDCPVCGDSMNMDWVDPMGGYIRTGYNMEGSI